MMNKKILAQGAEAILLLEKNKVIKRRIKKSYRIKELDERIRKLRTRSEAKLLEKAGKIISIPKVIKVDEKNKEIILEFIEGKKLSDNLDNFPLKQQKEVCTNLGKTVAKLHDANIIHGDLTTSNMILKDNQIYLIDFGLGYISRKHEDKAVDLHVLKEALEARHFSNWKTLWEEVEKSYSKENKDSKTILDRLKAVEKRGRYKH